MTIYLVHVQRSPSFIETVRFDSSKQALRYEGKMLSSGYCCVSGPDYPSTIEEDRYEQLTLF